MTWLALNLRGTLLGIGSLPSNGTLRQHGSLRQGGTLPFFGSLLSFGTLLSGGSLHPNFIWAIIATVIKTNIAPAPMMTQNAQLSSGFPYASLNRTALTF